MLLDSYWTTQFSPLLVRPKAPVFPLRGFQFWRAQRLWPGHGCHVGRCSGRNPPSLSTQYACRQDRFSSYRVAISPHTRSDEEERNGPPQPAPESHVLKAGPAAPRAQPCASRARSHLSRGILLHTSWWVFQHLTDWFMCDPVPWRSAAFPSLRSASMIRQHIFNQRK